jgi:hypothetical protein
MSPFLAVNTSFVGGEAWPSGDPCLHLVVTFDDGERLLRRVAEAQGHRSEAP